MSKSLELLRAREDALVSGIRSHESHIAMCKGEIAKFLQIVIEQEAELADVRAVILKLN